MNNVADDSKLIKKLAVAMTEFPGATLKEIAEAADISKATLHRLYGTRENLEAILTQKANETLNAFVAVTAIDYDDFRIGIRRLIEVSNDISELLGYIFVRQSNLDSEFWKGYYKALDNFFLKGQKKGFIRIDFPVPFLSEVFIATACCLPEAERRGRIASDCTDDLFEDFFLNGSVS